MSWIFVVTWVPSLGKYLESQPTWYNVMPTTRNFHASNQNCADTTCVLHCIKCRHTCEQVWWVSFGHCRVLVGLETSPENTPMRSSRTLSGHNCTLNSTHTSIRYAARIPNVTCYWIANVIHGIYENLTSSNVVRACDDDPSLTGPWAARRAGRWGGWWTVSG